MEELTINLTLSFNAPLTDTEADRFLDRFASVFEKLSDEGVLRIGQKEVIDYNIDRDAVF
jgi:hypothetical protein